MGSEEREAFVSTLSLHKASLLTMSVLIFISTGLSCPQADAKTLEEDVITEILLAVPEYLSLRSEALTLVCILGRWVDCTHWHVHNPCSQPTFVPIDLGRCHIELETLSVTL